MGNQEADNASDPISGLILEGADFVTGQVRLHFFPQTTVQNFLDSGI